MLLLLAIVVAGCRATDPSTATTERASEEAPEDPSISPPAAEPPEKQDSGASGRGFSAGPIDHFSTKRAMRHVRRLARDIGVRLRATEGERRAARYVAARFEALGYRVHVQRFDVDAGRSRNVVAWWPGAKDHAMVVGGHLDSVEGAPGANDNASGVAAILEVARLVAGRPPARLTRFVAFGSEEYGSNGLHHVGSAVFVNRLGNEGRRRLAGMLSVDMIADGRPLYVGNSDIADDVVAKDLLRTLGERRVDVEYRVMCDCSDHGPFELAGIPAAFMWSGEEPDYHSPGDTVVNMKPDDLGRTGRALRAYVKSFTPALMRRYRRAR